MGHVCCVTAVLLITAPTFTTDHCSVEICPIITTALVQMQIVGESVASCIPSEDRYSCRSLLSKGFSSFNIRCVGAKCMNHS